MYFHKHFFRRAAASLIVTAAGFLVTQPARAQTSVPRVEIGAQVSVIDLRDSLSEKPLGLGGRVGYNATDHLAVEAEVNHFFPPEIGNSRTQALFGVKAGKRFGDSDEPSVGLFLKARPGLVRFNGPAAPGVTVNGTTKPALDLGGVFEVYPSRRVVVRIDVGDTLIFYNGQTIRRLSLPGGPQEQLQTSHNFQAGIGVGFRF
jgi:hypothetical protein